MVLLRHGSAHICALDKTDIAPAQLIHIDLATPSNLRGLTSQALPTPTCISQFEPDVQLAELCGRFLPTIQGWKTLKRFYCICPSTLSAIEIASRDVYIDYRRPMM